MRKIVFKNILSKIKKLIGMKLKLKFKLVYYYQNFPFNSLQKTAFL